MKRKRDLGWGSAPGCLSVSNYHLYYYYYITSSHPIPHAIQTYSNIANTVKQAYPLSHHTTPNVKVKVKVVEYFRKGLGIKPPARHLSVLNHHLYYYYYIR